MRDRKTIEGENYTTRYSQEHGRHIQEEVLPAVILEVLLDCRELLQKLADKNTKKVITTEVNLSPKEEEVFRGVEEMYKHD